MSGETLSHESEGFVAPDESQRVVNSDLAEDMARESTYSRSMAARLRKDRSIMEEIGANHPTIEHTDGEASRHDETAEWREFLVPLTQEYQQQAQSMTAPELHRARGVLREKRNEMTDRIGWMDTVGATDQNVVDQKKKEFQRELAVNGAIDRIYRQQLETLGERPEYTV